MPEPPLDHRCSPPIKKGLWPSRHNREALSVPKYFVRSSSGRNSLRPPGEWRREEVLLPSLPSPHNHPSFPPSLHSAFRRSFTPFSLYCPLSSVHLISYLCPYLCAPSQIYHLLFTSGVTEGKFSSSFPTPYFLTSPLLSILLSSRSSFFVIFQHLRWNNYERQKKKKDKLHFFHSPFSLPRYPSFLFSSSFFKIWN